MRALFLVVILSLAFLPSNAAEITGFYVVNPETDETLLNGEALESGAILDIAQLGTGRITLKATASEDTAAVKLELSGDGEHTQHERIAPYALFGDTEGDFPSGNRRTLGLGTYDVTATPYASSNFRSAGAPKTFHVTILDGTQVAPCQFDVQVTSCDTETVADAVAAAGESCDISAITDQLEFKCTHARLNADVGTPIPQLIQEFGRDFSDKDLENYFNGGTWLNERTGSLEEEAPFIAQIQEFAQQGTIAYPDHLRTFGECDVGAVVCVWIRDRQPGDNNGNCRNPLDKRCVDADPADNTDLCYADASRSPEAVHVPEGVVRFPGETEGDVHAHGFAFKDGSLSSRFMGNILWFVSFYDHLSQRGYAENVPLAPMCGCVDQMPTISRADCTEVDVDETFRVSMNGGLDTLAAERLSVEIDFNACDGETANDLGSEFKQLYGEGDALEVFEEYLVGPANNNDASNCPE